MQRALNPAALLLTCAVFFQHGAPVLQENRIQDRLQLFEHPSAGHIGLDLCGLIQHTRTMNWMVHWSWKF